jgi:hypothetical protein
VLACPLPPLIELHISYDGGLRWIIHGDEYYYDVFALQL